MRDTDRARRTTRGVPGFRCGTGKVHEPVALMRSKSMSHRATRTNHHSILTAPPPGPRREGGAVLERTENAAARSERPADPLHQAAFSMTMAQAHHVVFIINSTGALPTDLGPETDENPPEGIMGETGASNAGVAK